MTSANSPQTGLLPMELPLTRSAEGSRARMLARQDQVRELRERALASGLSMRVLLASYDRKSSSWKTSQSCAVEGLETFSDRWPKSGTMLSGTAYQLPPLVDCTNENASGSPLIPTPLASDANGSGCPRLERASGISLKDWFKHVYGFLYPPADAVEFLMGYPTGHTDLRPSETP
jgi:hypothetical protein